MSGFGTFQFTVPVFTYVSTPNPYAGGTTFFGFGYSDGNYSTNAGLIDVMPREVSSWDMLRSFAPITAEGEAVDWTDTPMKTSGGTVKIFNQSLPITFQATTQQTPKPFTLSPKWGRSFTLKSDQDAETQGDSKNQKVLRQWSPNDHSKRSLFRCSSY
jgi:hypothetical protein